MPGLPRHEPRILPGTRREIGALNAMIARLLGVAAGGPPPNIFTTLGKHRRLFLQWLVFAGGLMPGGALPRRETELMILHVARHMRCDYEWIHHLRLGKKAGVTDQEIAQIHAADLEGGGFSARELAMFRAATDFMEHPSIGQERWDDLRPHLSDKEIIEFCLLIGHYQMLAKTLNSLGVQPEGAH